MRYLFVIAAVVACTKSAPPPAGIPAHVTLKRAASCDALQQNVQDTAVRQMRTQMDAYKDWTNYGYPMAAGGDTAGATPSTQASQPAGYSTTNVQVAGVDEADFVKNDGTRIFTLSGQTLYAVQSWPPQSLAVKGTLDLEGWPSSMFLDGDRLVILSGIWSQQAGPMPMGAGLMPIFYGTADTKITIVDVSDLANPRVSSELKLPGSSSGARRVGDSVRVVLSDGVRWPDGLQWWPPYDDRLYRDHDLWVAAIDQLEDQNESIIRKTPLQKWFPGEYSCSDFYLSNAPERLGLVTVATLDLAHPDRVSRASIVGEAGIVYATAEHLYIASEHWWWWWWSGERDYTYIHEFDISDPSSAGYVGSGGVEGHVGDQFAMDEHEGYLRVATSTQTRSSDPNAVHGVDVSSRLTVLAPKDGELAKVGELAPIEDNERLMATRFTGATGYAVTFRNIDPLVTLDLSDPAHPRKIAELTIPGFSTYLQPIDATHLLAIGEDMSVDAHGIPDWSHQSMQLSLFDVSDLSHPVRTANTVVGTAWASSEAMWDHHAFNWYQGLLAIPFSDWTAGSWDGFVSDVRIFGVDPATGIKPLGALGIGDVYVKQGYGDWTWYWRPWVRRSVLATDQGGAVFVYAVSDAGIRVAPLDHLDQPLATALFSPPTK